ncbi:hypothetical protein QL285_062906 [Trifolium repens]|nr:hypothetical protein QL285_062906 [Trifolium repens]
MTKTGPNMKENLHNRRKASRQSKEYKKTRKSQKCEDLCCSSCHDDFHRARMEATCSPRHQQRKSEENLFIMLRWPSSWYDGFTWRPS